MEGVSVLTVKEIVGILQKEDIEIIIVKGTSDYADHPKDVLSNVYLTVVPYQ